MQARPFRDRVTRRSWSEREARILRSKRSQVYIYLTGMSYLIVPALQQSKSAIHLTLHLSCTVQGYHMQRKILSTAYSSQSTSFHSQRLPCAQTFSLFVNLLSIPIALKGLGLSIALRTGTGLLEHWRMLCWYSH